MTTWDEIYPYIEEIRSRLLKVFILLIILSIVFFSFGIKENIPYPTVENSFAVITFNYLIQSLLPADVEPIVTKPTDAVRIQIQISLFLALLAGFPIILYHLFKFLLPAFLPKEKKIFFTIFSLSLFLFISGAVFSYFVMLPLMLKFLYAFATPLGVLTFIDIAAFLSLVTSFILIFGIIFTTPMIMLSLKYVGVSYKFWISNWKYALLIFIIFGAIITPDGSGLTQLIVALPLLALYFIGILMTKYIKL